MSVILIALLGILILSMAFTRRALVSRHKDTGGGPPPPPFAPAEEAIQDWAFMANLVSKSNGTIQCFE